MSLEGLELELIIDLVESMAVVIVVAYLFTRTGLYRQVLDRQLGRQGRLLLVLIFGAFSIWGTLSGVEIDGAIANTRDLGPALGGLIGGPLVGLGAGVIGGLHRLSMGGWTAVPSALGAVTAGLAGGAVFLLFGRRVAPVWAAMLLAVITESMLMGLNLLMAKPFGDALKLVEEVIAPMILVNAAGMGLFVFIVRNVARERETSAQKERMEGELTVARDIQRSIVPTIFPPFPEREEFDLHAVLEPAREVGGDLYDFFLLDDDHLCLAVGDVSGKGVPASLFMAVTITLLRAAGTRTTDPAGVLAQVNEPLCRGNDAAMFVTLFYGVYRISTGELVYSTGGHLPPYLVRAGGGLEAAARTPGPGLGVSPAAAFGTASLRLQPGDALLLFTDGVSEAMDDSRRMFGTGRLESVLRETDAGDGARGLVTAVRAAVDTFAAGAEQYDDVTVLGFRRTV
jgi:sigma-B regulation protein RsbU (phosphoserine phosphatase)